ncbi:cell division protein FtsL [Geminocystis sp. NIES-3709]|nr:cell division protein FtsL [Geminocystis sp. NIES-3709]
MILGHGSSALCYLSVVIAFVMYGITVYAPKLWTTKYHELQDLQKQERQFSFTDEIIKNQLAESAKQSGSGLVNPDSSQPPIFLPDTTPKPIQLETSPSSEPKQIEKISPIAY